MGIHKTAPVYTIAHLQWRSITNCMTNPPRKIVVVHWKMVLDQDRVAFRVKRREIQKVTYLLTHLGIWGFVFYSYRAQKLSMSFVVGK